MTDLAIINARILTLEGDPAVRRGHRLRDLGLIERGWVRISHAEIVEVQAGERKPGDFPSHVRTIDAQGRVVLPGFVDCHTHACWAGHRYDDFEKHLGGATYLDVLQEGGGIMSTVRDTRAAGEDELTRLLLRRIARMRALGTTTIEVKSGYGLTSDDELKMLRAIRAAQGRTEEQLITTFLGAHAKPPENPNYVEETINQTLPEIVSEFHQLAVDAYCEQGAWTLDETRQLFEEAQALACPIRVHTDQFNSLGATRLAVEMGALSADHLEAITPVDLERLARSDTIGVALPCSGFHLDGRYAPARALVDSDGALAIATNYNPGSAPTPSMPFAIALACRALRLTPAEAIVAATFNAACVLQLEHEIGSLEVGKRADLQVLDVEDERDLAYEFATAGPAYVVAGGKIVHERVTR